MVSRIACCVFLALSVHAGAELDLTPRVHVSELEGYKEEITAFRNGPTLVTWHSPHGWRLTGGGAKVTITPPDTSQAEARIEVAGPASESPLDEPSARKLKEELAGALPREVINVHWAEDEAAGLSINGHPAYKVTFSYTLAAQRFTESVWVCNFAKEQIRFHLTARAREFEKLQEIFRQSLYTWQGLE